MNAIAVFMSESLMRFPNVFIDIINKLAYLIVIIGKHDISGSHLMFVSYKLLSINQWCEHNHMSIKV